jgi:membrane protease YdiL (CAAX protease family)
VFVVSVAEVLVCWSLVGATFESVLQPRLGRGAVFVAAVVAAVLFGLYHFAHSAPFNTWAMVGLLAVVGLVTGLFFFVSRDALGTAVFHNFLGTFGVTQALEKAGALGTLEVLQPPLVGTALTTAAVLMVGYKLVQRPV